LLLQALLYAVGLGKGAIPTAAAVNWVLRDGIGYLSKIVLSKYGRHFDVHPKGWRLVSDVIENMSYGLELLTPTFPHLFVYLAAAAGAGRSAAGLIQVWNVTLGVEIVVILELLYLNEEVKGKQRKTIVFRGKGYSGF